LGLANGENTVSRVIALANDSKFDFVFHIGDMSYADDYSAGFYEEVWNGWFAEMQPIMTNKFYMVCPGNHEYSCEHDGCLNYSQNFTAFLNRFLMPWQRSGAQNNMWFSFDYGNVHYVMVSTETDFPNAPEGPTLFGATQLAWLEKDLMSVDKSVTPWIVAGGHRPIYCSRRGYSDSNGVPISDPANLQKAMEDLFYKYGVDLFLTGHVHAYERMYPTYANSATSQDYNNPTATTYVIAGAAGNTEGLSNDKNSSWNSPSPNWSAHRYGEGFGYGMLSFWDNSSTQQHYAQWQFFRSLDNGVEDEFTITKDF
jgi:predicted phosphodiesterase